MPRAAAKGAAYPLTDVWRAARPSVLLVCCCGTLLGRRAQHSRRRPCIHRGPLLPCSARKLFRGSLLYLPLLLLALAAHRQPNTHEIADLAAAEARLAAQWQAAKQYLAPLRQGAGQQGEAADGVRLRNVEERLGWSEELRWRLLKVQPGIKCPSRAYAEEGQLEQLEQLEQQEQQQEQQQQQQQQREEK